MAKINRTLMKETLRDDSPFVRENAVLDIAKAVEWRDLSENEACIYLCPLLEGDPDESVREHTVGAIWRVIDDERSRKSLGKAITSDSSTLVRLLAVSCLKSYYEMGGGDYNATKYMIRAANEDEDLRVRRFAQSCLKLLLKIRSDELSSDHKQQIEDACQTLPTGFRESMDAELLMFMNALYAGPISDGSITESEISMDVVEEKRQSLTDVIPALIEALQMNIRKTVLKALKVITGQDFGENQEAWAQWWRGTKQQ